MTGTLSPVSRLPTHVIDYRVLWRFKGASDLPWKGTGEKIRRKKEKKTHLIFFHIWVFSGPGGFDVEMVKQLLKEEESIINIQLLCNSHSSLKGAKAHSSLEVTVGKCRHYLMAELWKSSLGPSELCLHRGCSLNSPHRKWWFCFICFASDQALDRPWAFRNIRKPTGDF